jgi:type II secretory ATPase GspE/PulE/Tfp pilus assembly ATPase PilB-like protein
MQPGAEAVLMRALKQPYGAVLTVGPTGSGKTTTLYAALEFLNDDERSLATIEDPVENQIPGITQVEVNVRAGLTFASGLRTMLRSDPDVVLIGEVRDEETARIAIQAAMTGHLVLTTLHTHNAASSIARLRDMGVDQSLIATSVNCIVAAAARAPPVRPLPRGVCPDAGGEDRRRASTASSRRARCLYRPRGCAECADMGYNGRVAHLRGDADQRQDPASDRGVDRGDLRRRGRRRDDHPPRGRDSPLPGGHHLARGDPPGHRRPLM